ncbi:peroxisomal and mitochondrial division factor 1-like [Lathyrus oleraceus]|uniref:peroxisomal and mitochondrial division factor 1-like n=1 Tax=Pisum sativum TaxID=3888 RepID=UPI0021D24D53|nr:peroxisomal and mitochondrial division factor 1-like [Pisum sativum]
MELEQTKLKNKEKIEGHDRDIASWRKQIEELQKKIPDAERSKSQLLEFDDALMAKELEFGEIEKKSGSKGASWDAATESTNKAMELEQTKLKNKEKIEGHDRDIASWRKQIKELQAKISDAERRKSQLLEFDDALMDKDLEFGEIEKKSGSKGASWDAATESTNKAMELEQTKLKNKEKIEGHDRDIASWRKQIKELQAKISDAERRKSQLLEFDDALMDKDLEFGMKFVEQAQKLESDLKLLQSKANLPFRSRPTFLSNFSPFHFGDHFPKVISFRSIGRITSQTKSSGEKLLTFTVLL